MRPFLIPFLILLAALATAADPNVIGVWKGKVVVDFSKMEKIANAAERQQIMAQAAKTNGVAVSMTLKKDKTYSATAGNGSKADTGTWSQSGTRVTLRSTKRNASGSYRPEIFFVSADGKSMTLLMPSYRGITAKVVLKR